MATKKVMGVIEALNFKEIPNGPDQFGNNFRRSMKVNGEWYSFGSCKQDKWNVKQGMEFKVLGVGSEVVFPATSREYQGKTYWDAKAGSMAILEFVEASNEAPKPQGNSQAKPAQQNASSGASTGFKRDDTAVIAGNSRTAAFAFLKGKPYKKIAEVNALVEQFAILSDNKRKAYKAANPSLDDFQVGVSVGQSVVLAAGIAKTFEDVDGIVDEILEQVIPFSVQVVKDVAAGKYNEPEPDDYEGSEEELDDGSELPF